MLCILYVLGVLHDLHKSSTMTVWKYDNFCLKYFREVNNCYAIKVVSQISVCICEWFCLRLQADIVKSVNNINIAKLLITVDFKCPKILWWKLDGYFRRCRSFRVYCLQCVHQTVWTFGLKWSQILSDQKIQLRQQRTTFGVSHRCIICSILSYYTYDSTYNTKVWSVCFHLFLGFSMAQQNI